ncbi:MAG: polysaccharide deacetylase family protein [Chitinophagaceae bacterium]
MQYFVKTPWWLKKIYPRRLWKMNTKDKIVYLTFDDGPHPLATPFVLDQLKRYQAKATFFCIGKNVVEYPSIYQRILQEGHRTGNHTYTHPNGWKKSPGIYLEDIKEATKYIRSKLFRPPYGRISQSQAKGINEAIGDRSAKIVMWDVLSGDFDESLIKEKCLENVIKNSSAGSIVVFHDSEKAFPRLEYVLPRVLEFFSGKGYAFGSLE